MTLFEEITARCSPALLASKDHAAIADLVSTGRVRSVHVPIGDLQAYLQTNGTWWAIKAATTNPAAVAVVDVASARYDNVDVSLPGVQSMLAGLVATGLISANDLTAITAMSVVPDPVSLIQVAQSIENGV